MKITNRIDLEVFGEKLRMAGILIPENIDMVVSGLLGDLETLSGHRLGDEISYRTKSDYLFKIKK